MFFRRFLSVATSANTLSSSPLTFLASKEVKEATALIQKRLDCNSLLLSEGLALPYFVERTKVGKNLPVYSEIRRQGQIQLTIIRRIYGDINVIEILSVIFLEIEG